VGRKLKDKKATDSGSLSFGFWDTYTSQLVTIPKNKDHHHVMAFLSFVGMPRFELGTPRPPDYFSPSAIFSHLRQNVVIT